MKYQVTYKPILVFVVAFGMPATLIGASSGSFFSKYNLGVSYQSTSSHAEIIYDTPTTRETPENCEINKQREGVFRCTAYLGPSDDDSESFSVFLEKAFKREGLFYFGPGLTISTITYKGSLIDKPESSPVAGSSAKKRKAPTQPLNKAHLELYGVNWQGYLRFGITPLYLPDIFFTVGAGIQTVTGTVKLFTKRYTRYVIQPDFFAELEAVFIRYKSGSMSIFYGQDQSFVSQLGSNLVDDYPDGSSISNVRLGLSSGTAGARIVFPF